MMIVSLQPVESCRAAYTPEAEVPAQLLDRMKHEEPALTVKLSTAEVMDLQDGVVIQVERRSPGGCERPSGHRLNTSCSVNSVSR